MTLPLSYSRLRDARSSPRVASAGQPAEPSRTTSRSATPFNRSSYRLRSTEFAQMPMRAAHRPSKHRRGPLPTNLLRAARQPSTRAAYKKVGGEGRVRTSVATRAAGLQPAAIDRSATSPNSISRAVPPAFTRSARTPIAMSWNRGCAFPKRIRLEFDGAGGGI